MHARTLRGSGERRETTGPAEGEIHLWVVLQHEADRAALFEDYSALLTEDEHLKASRFYFEEHRSQYLVARALVRTVLSGYSGIDPRAWRFSTNSYGRPYIDAPDAQLPLSFNVTHTDGLIVCACVRGGCVGVDAEHLRLDNVPLDIADRYFSAVELAELRALTMEACAQKFFYYWTLKESYIKAIGKGLSTPLDQFSFSLHCPGRIHLSFHDGCGDDPLNWRCWLIRLAEGHVVGICAARTPLKAQRLVVRKVVPLAFEAPLEFELLGQSPD